ncbi:MAG TPA: sulfatase-like hydrolase/transferase [Thermoanaerobaculia bacterium]
MRRLAPLLLLLLACSRAEDAPRPSIVLISVDTLRSDRLPAYGYAKGATPNIDALRRDGILYERAYSHAPLTLPSHLSMLTGLLPNEHGVRNNIGYRFEGSKFRTLAQVLRESGYRTGAAVSSYVLRSETGMAAGFDVYDDDVPSRPGAAAAENMRPGFETLRRARDLVTGPAPFLLFFHIYEPHAPYAPPDPFRTRFADPYDGEIAASDAIVGELVAALKSSGVYDDALIVFTSDHGEALWEHGEDQHGILLYREVLQVPLVVKLPRGERAGTSVAEPFALRQIFDLALRTAGIASEAREGPVYSETFYPRIHLGWSELRSLIDGRYHYIESSRPELYDLASDPRETVNVIARERRVAAAMRTALAAIPAGDATVGAIDPEDAKQLAALGYVGTVRQRTGPLPNPREQIHLLRDLKHAFRLAAEHRTDEAIAAFRGLLQANPALTDVSTRLGEVLMESGRAEEAVEVYRAAIARSERFSPDLSLALAAALSRAGHHREAAKHAQAALAAGGREPREFLMLAEMQRASGDYAAALQTLDRAGDVEGVDHARGDIHARSDRPEEAIAAYRREIARHPAHLQSYANLAVIYMILGRTREAEEALAEMVRANPNDAARALARRTRAAFGT